MILTDFFKALMQLPDRRFRRVLWLGIGLALALLVAAYALFLWLVSAIDASAISIPGIGPITWLGDLLSFGSILLMFILSMFLMVPVASAITSLFLDDVAQAVEDQHYPHLPPIPRLSWGNVVRDTVNFLGLLVGANILAFAIYAVLPFAAIPIFWALNGFLLGREYFQMAAMRRVGRQAAKDLRVQHRLQIWFAGCLMAMPLSVPLLNLLIPVLGAATFTHMFHRLNRG